MLACSGDAPDPPAPGSQAVDTGEPIDWQALPGPCQAPADLPEDPVTPGPIWQHEDLGGMTLIELVELEAHEDLGQLWAGGQSGLLVFDWDLASGELTFVSMFPDNGFGRFERLERLDDGFVAGANRAVNIEIIDLQDPEAPARGWLIPESGFTGLHHLDGLLYAAHQSGELVTFEVQDGGHAVEIDRVSGLASPWEIVRVDDRLYVADQTLGIVVVDVTEPNHPLVLGAVETAGGALDLDTDGDSLFVAIGGAGFEILSLADPDTPASLAVVETGSPVVSVAEGGGLLWGADHEGVLSADVSDPAAPMLLGFEKTTEYALHVEAAGDRAWVADWGDVPSYVTDRAIAAPEARPSPSRIFLTRAHEPSRMTLYNGGSDTLVLHGGAVGDDRVDVRVSGTEAGPGETLIFELVAGEDGAELATTLCLATNDPDQPELELEVGAASFNTDVFAGAGELQVGDAAPDFTLMDIAGNSWRLSEQLGHPVVLIYFATW